MKKQCRVRRRREQDRRTVQIESVTVNPRAALMELAVATGLQVLARMLEEKGQINEAIAEYRKALDQLMDSEPVIYQLLGAAYERQQKYKEAIAAYEKYLTLAPNGSLAPALRSIIDQLKRDEAGVEIIP